jgi:antitoxin component YwqK of YwqJK toxin-antitoxin module
MKLTPLVYLLFIPGLLVIACTRVQTEKWPNGNKKSEITMHGGQRNGPAKYWYEDGNIQMECIYKNDRLNGNLIRYFAFPNGSREEQHTYINDTLDGIDLLWDRSGNPLIHSQFSKGKLHGTYREFYENKLIKAEGNYMNGNIDGLWLYYDDTGLVVGKGNFTMGNGEQRSFYTGTQQIKMITPYRNNLRDGTEIEYSPEGKVQRKKIYSAGKVTEVIDTPLP